MGVEGGSGGALGALRRELRGSVFVAACTGRGFNWAMLGGFNWVMLEAL